MQVDTYSGIPAQAAANYQIRPWTYVGEGVGKRKLFTVCGGNKD